LNRQSPASALNRRTALKSFAALGAGSVIASCTPPAKAQAVFTHGVASGDPTQTAVIIWTRVAPEDGTPAPVTGTWDVAEDEAFTRILQSGAFATGPERDYTVKIDVTDLPPGKRLSYRFAAGEKVSPIGRAITLPAGDVKQLRIALFSCSNYAFGFFNAYKHCAARDDIDLALHVGDYIYEYGAGKYGDPVMESGERRLVPEHEIVTLADYRARHALYRADQDLQEIHRRLPFVTVWDDHEITNDAWVGGAQNHQPNEGDWESRRAAAVRAYFEWMPVRPMSSNDSTRAYRALTIGNLATLVMLDTRLYGRDRPLDYEIDVPTIEEADGVRPNWTGFRNLLADPKRTILGAEQEAWLDETLRRSHLQGVKWRIFGQQTLLGHLSSPDPTPLLRGPLDEKQKKLAGLLTEIARENLPLFLDSFGGSYRPARERLLNAITATGGNAVILTGDSHNAWAFNLRDSEGNVAAVEIGATSVTSPGIEADLPIDPVEGEKALVEKNPELAYCKLNARGYSVVTVAPDAVTAEWVYIDTITSRSFNAEVGKTTRIAHASTGGTTPVA
jgi:alkaline phosphatase D